MCAFQFTLSSEDAFEVDELKNVIYHLSPFLKFLYLDSQIFNRMKSGFKVIIQFYDD